MMQARQNGRSGNLSFPYRWTARPTGASLRSNRCVRDDLTERSSLGVRKSQPSLQLSLQDPVFGGVAEVVGIGLA